MDYYQQLIRERLATMGFVGKYDPRHVEAYIRLEHSTLDALDKRQWNAEIKIAVSCIDGSGTKQAERLAKSYGL